jgi:myosin-5
MADTYTKGTRVWFPDKDTGWISGEVTAVSKNEGALKLTFVDERGKVPIFVVPWLQREIMTDARRVRLLGACYPHDDKGCEGRQQCTPTTTESAALETPEDLATLSHLNEPSGKYRELRT